MSVERSVEIKIPRAAATTTDAVTTPPCSSSRAATAVQHNLQEEEVGHVSWDEVLLHHRQMNLPLYFASHTPECTVDCLTFLFSFLVKKALAAPEPCWEAYLARTSGVYLHK